MSLAGMDAWIELLATGEDRAVMERCLGDLGLRVWVHHRDAPPSGRGADVLVVSIPEPPRPVAATHLPTDRRITAASFFRDTWHGLIRDASDEGVPVLVAVPDGYPALDAVFASGATEVLEGAVTPAAVRSRLRALHARQMAQVTGGASHGRVRELWVTELTPRLPPARKRRAAAASPEPRGLLGSYPGTVHEPTSGRIDAKRVAEFFGVPLRRLTESLGLAYGTVHKTPDAVSVQPPLRPLAGIVASLNELGASPREIRIWLNRPLPDLEGDSPLDTILAGEAEAVEALLRSAGEGIPG